jgi:hypothetical protein
MFSGVSGIAVSLYYWSEKLAVIGWQLAVKSQNKKVLTVRIVCRPAF